MLYSLMRGRKNGKLFIFLFEALLFFSEFFNYSLIFPNCFNGLPLSFDSLPLQAGAFTRHSFSFDEACQPCTDAHPYGCLPVSGSKKVGAAVVSAKRWQKL